jgi:hypothetical protein
LSGAVVKLASINLWKLVISPTGSINTGFILREDLLLCSSYLPLGVPNWAFIYTPSEVPSISPKLEQYFLQDEAKYLINLRMITISLVRRVILQIKYLL